MCGICGIYNLKEKHRIEERQIAPMLARLKHRGPDESGLHIHEGCIGLGAARLSIIGLNNGRQPLHNESQSCWLVINGEIFNFVELKADLLKKGHRFHSDSDGEVVLHLYEEMGIECLDLLNGQFAFALWDAGLRTLVLARDRVGIMPLFYTIADGSLLFASEIKALFADKRVTRDIDPVGIDHLFTFWAMLPPHTGFKDIHELAPAHYLTAHKGRISIKRYWSIPFAASSKETRKRQDYCEEFLSLLRDAVRIRLRADVSVGAYLSGGLDSSFITALAKEHAGTLHTFSVRFSEEMFDEGRYQNRVARSLGSRHHEMSCSCQDIGRLMPQVVWHAEKPLVRTAPVPLFLLSQMVNAHGIKVVLTGEGADEMFAGYDLFKEAKIRRFWSRRPGSARRPLLFRRINAGAPGMSARQSDAYRAAFYKTRLEHADKVCFSHMPRWQTTAQTKLLFSEAFRERLGGYNSIDYLCRSLPEQICAWDHLAQAQCIEIITLLSGNLLCSQGDRMLMAHSVEGRFPFLDHRIIEFAAALPARMKLRALNGKYIVKEAARPFLPEDIVMRPKKAYQAPEAESLLGPHMPDYVRSLLSSRRLAKSTCFEPKAVKDLVKKYRQGRQSSVRFSIALVGVLTTLMWEELFLRARPDMVGGALSEAGNSSLVKA